jgi:hypothetical protein
LFFVFGKDPIHCRIIVYIALFNKGHPNFFRQRLDALLQLRDAIAKRQGRALRMERLRDPPGNRILVGDTEYKNFLSVQQTHDPLLRQ